MNDLEKSKQILKSGEYTCVLSKGDKVYTCRDRGVKPLVKWLESDDDFEGFSAADKVVGKGAAFLYLLLGIKCVYADVISVPALSLLQKHNVEVEYKTKADYIINRKGDGICPFERAVLEISDAKTAYTAIRNKMKEMNIEI